ncbi:MAG TPA: hypothetical protein DCR55_11445 [Lentisphaeria bacterium]|nr:hypothetical protein [Lentisphaeria bacterium]
MNESGSENRALDAVEDGLRTVVRLMKVLMVLLAVAFCVSGVRSLEQFETAVVLRFGSVQDMHKDPGLVLALPSPIDELVVLDAKRPRSFERTTFWHNLKPNPDGSQPAVRESMRPTVDRYLVSADSAILHTKAVVRYQVGELVPYAFRAREMDRVLHNLCDNALVAVVSRYPLAEAMTRKSEVGAEVRRHLQERVNTLRLGVTIDAVDLALAWPKQLAPQLAEVGAARNEAGRLKAEAESVQGRMVSEAESAQKQIVSAAETWATRKESRVRADAANFAKLHELYQQNPEVIRQTLYLDRMRTALSNADEIFLLDGGENQELRLSVPRQTKKSLVQP